MNIAVDTPPTARTAQRVRQLLGDRPVVVLSLVLVGFYLLVAVLDHSLLTTGGLRSILLLACPLALFAAGQTLAFLTGGIDLSVTMIANFAAYMAATRSGAGPWVALSLGFLVAIAAGLLNGIGIGIFRVHPLIMTIGMSSVVLGVVSVGLSGSGFLAGSSNVLPLLSTIGGGNLVGPVPNSFIVWIVVSILIIYGLSRSGLGRNIYAIGDNPESCKRAGVKVWRVLVVTYVLVALLAALAGMIISGTSGSVGPSQTDSYLLPSIAAAVVGGTSILGGRGGYGGTIVAALILTVLKRLLLWLEAGLAIQQMVYGVIVLVLAWIYVSISRERTD